MKKTVAATLLGLILGILAARYVLVGSWFNLVPWGIAGVAIGYFGTKNESVVNGVVYGFILVFVFMIEGYSGTHSLVSRLPFFAILGVFGAACGLGLGLVGFQIRTKIDGRRRS